jgi:hypothetical protein
MTVHKILFQWLRLKFLKVLFTFAFTIYVNILNVHYFRGYAAVDGDKFACMDKIRQYNAS